MMLIPKKDLGMGFFDDMFNEPFFNRKENNFMKTDIKEKDGKYLVSVDLPGYEKDNISIEIEDGYLTVTATEQENINDESEKYIHKERYVGKCSRSFYVGENIEDSDIKASYKNGTLNLEFPKVKEKEVEKKRNIPID